jgi:hypothetical protein
MGAALRLGVIAMAMLLASQAFAKSPSAARYKVNRIDIKYVEPTSADHQPVLKLLKEARALEKIQALLAPIRLPRRLLLQTKGCDGVSNAWYDGESVTVCYEYLDDLWKAAPEQATSNGLAPIDTLIGPVADVFLHEAGHAVYDILQVPRLGREEDAADQFSTFILLRFPKADARRLILGSAYQYKGDLTSPSVSMKQQQFADEHGTPAQRFYNLLCMAYGADKELFADLVSKGLLPKDRAEGCEDEYQQVAFAMDKLIAPYVDRRLARKLHRPWLPPTTVKLKRWRSQ